jgi:hypothetical protein
MYGVTGGRIWIERGRRIALCFFIENIMGLGIYVDIVTG